MSGVAEAAGFGDAAAAFTNGSRVKCTAAGRHVNGIAGISRRAPVAAGCFPPSNDGLAAIGAKTSGAAQSAAESTSSLCR
jgi:hypothetical protein